MKFCPYCGQRVDSEFDYCPNCGKKLIDEGSSSSEKANSDAIHITDAPNYHAVKQNDNAYTIAYVFMVIGTVISAFLIIPMCWTIPMTIYYKNAHERGEDVSLAFKICTLLFVSLIGGIFMFVNDDDIK